MVVAVEARKLSLPYPSLSSSQVTSLFYHPNSLSLALMHVDSTFSLFPSFSPFSLSSSSSLPPSQTLIPPPSSSACFVSLNPNPKIPDCTDNTHVVFVTAGPHNGGSRIVLRFYLLGKDGNFVNAHMGCSQKGVCFDGKLGVIVDVSHGMKVMLSGSVNYFAMYSPLGGKVCVFGLKLVGGGRDLRLVKCAVIDCRLPISSICISFGLLILGELGGVRVFPLRALVKGRLGSRRRSRVVRGKVESVKGEQQEVNVKSDGLNLKMPNGVIRPFDEIYGIDKNVMDSNSSKLLPNGHVYNFVNGASSNSNADGNHDTVKPRSLKLRQDSGEWGMQFVVFNDSINEAIKHKAKQYKTAKAISIQPLSQQQSLILDSNGYLHVLHVSKFGPAQVKQLSGTIQVQQLAAFPDTSANSHTFWVSDGLNSVHMMEVPGPDTAENENDGSASEGKIIKSSGLRDYNF